MGIPDPTLHIHITSEDIEGGIPPWEGGGQGCQDVYCPEVMTHRMIAELSSDYGTEKLEVAYLCKQHIPIYRSAFLEDMIALKANIEAEEENDDGSEYDYGLDDWKEV